jgi:hypothetical protein
VSLLNPFSPKLSQNLSTYSYFIWSTTIATTKLTLSFCDFADIEEEINRDKKYILSTFMAKSKLINNIS